MRSCRSFSCSLALLFFIVSSPIKAAPIYAFRIGGVSDIVTAIGANGTVAGNRNGTAFIFRNGVYTNIGQASGTFTNLYGVNDAGQAVGIRTDFSIPQQFAIYWDGAAFVDLAIGAALDITNSGVVAGWNRVGSDLSAFTWSGGVLTQRPQLTTATTINEAGLLGGGAPQPGYTAPAVLPPGAGTAVLLFPAPYTDEVQAVSEAGHAAGWRSDPGIPGQPVGFICPPGGSTCALFPNVFLLGVNSNGDAVGFRVLSNESEAVIVSNGVLYSLDQFLAPGLMPAGFRFRGAEGINDRGEIVAWGTDERGDQYSYLLTSIPEPGSIGVTALGAGLILWLRRRKIA